MRWAGHVARKVQMNNGYRLLVEKHEGRRPLGKPEREKEDNIKMNLRKREFECMDWSHKAQDRDR
jgi:hypothetical protein